MLVASLGGNLHRFATVVFTWLPHLLAAILVLIVGYLVARVVAALVRKALRRAGFDRTLHSGTGGNYISRLTKSPSGVVGTIAFWAILLGAISLAASVLGVAALTAFVGTVFAYLPNVIAALLIFLVAGAVATAIAALVSRTMGETPTGKILATVAPALIMGIAIFMILNQLKIAPAIVTITYAAIMGAVALGAALAFGLGGRDVAARMLETAYAKGQENADQVKQDLQTGKERTVREAREQATKVETDRRPGAVAAK